jgi:ketosteroid isomerase-like protein
MTTEKEIVAMEREALEEWAGGRPSKYLKHAAADMTYYDDIGAQGGLQGLETVRGYATAALDGNIPPHQYEMLGTHVQDYGDTSILTYEYQPSTPDGQKLTRWRASVVYNKSGGQWQMVHAHWTMQKEQGEG